MTEKRYYAHKHLLQENKVHDKICHRFMNITETVEHMNMYYHKYTALKQENEQLKFELQNTSYQRDEFHRGARENANRVGKLEKKNGQLKEENKKLKKLVSEEDNELEIRDIVCGAGKFRLEEWGKYRHHQFYKGDEELEDESVVIMLMELEKENKELKKENEQLKKDNNELENEIEKLESKLWNCQNVR